MRVFEYIADRGIMINPVDRFRNVSFRSDTYVKFCSEMYNRIREISNDDTAMESFFASGYNSGSSFGRRLEDQFSISSRPLSTEEKIKRWCEFDSSVGWGKFRSTLTINEEEGTIDGFLTINECFIVDKIGKRKICQFIVGYCSGVLEQILNGVPVEIKCVGCPLNNRFKNECKFEVKVKE
jgi:predicted hydrocarbon binding protein